MKQKKNFLVFVPHAETKLSCMRMFTVAENFYATLSVSKQIPPKNVLLLHASSFAL